MLMQLIVESESASRYLQILEDLLVLMNHSSLTMLNRIRLIGMSWIIHHKFGHVKGVVIINMAFSITSKIFPTLMPKWLDNSDFVESEKTNRGPRISAMAATNQANIDFPAYFDKLVYVIGIDYENEFYVSMHLFLVILIVALTYIFNT